MVPEKCAGDGEDQRPCELQSEHRKDTLDRVGAVLFEKDRQRDVVHGAERKVIDHGLKSVREECQGDRCTGKKEDDGFFHDVDAPGRFRVEADRCDDHFHTEVDDQRDHCRDRKVKKVDSHRDRAVGDDHDDDECRDESQCEENHVRAAVAPECVASELHRFQKIEDDLSRLDRAAHIPDDEHLEEVKKRGREDQVDHRVGKGHAVDDVRSGGVVDRSPEEVHEHEIDKICKERDRGAEAVMERFHDARTRQRQSFSQVHFAPPSWSASASLTAAAPAASAASADAFGAESDTASSPP